MIITLITYWPDFQYACFKNVNISDKATEPEIIECAREKSEGGELLAVSWGTEFRLTHVHLLQNGQTHAGRSVHLFLRETYRQDWDCITEAPDLIPLMEIAIQKSAQGR